MHTQPKTFSNTLVRKLYLSSVIFLSKNENAEFILTLMPPTILHFFGKTQRAPAKFCILNDFTFKDFFFAIDIAMRSK